MSRTGFENILRSLAQAHTREVLEGAETPAFHQLLQDLGAKHLQEVESLRAIANAQTREVEELTRSLLLERKEKGDQLIILGREIDKATLEADRLRQTVTEQRTLLEDRQLEVKMLNMEIARLREPDVAPELEVPRLNNQAAASPEWEVPLEMPQALAADASADKVPVSKSNSVFNTQHWVEGAPPVRFPAELHLSGNQPIAFAEIRNDLLAWESGFERRNSEGGYLLHLCAYCVAEDPLVVAKTVKLLAQQKWDPTRRNRLDETPLHLAVRRKAAPPVVEALLDAHAEPNITSYHGETPLLMAVGNNDKSLVQVLLKGRATPNIGDALGETALMQAVHSGDTEMCALLLGGRADPEKTNEFQLTAIDYSEDPLIAELFRKALAGDPTPDTVTQSSSSTACAAECLWGRSSSSTAVKVEQPLEILRWVIPSARLRGIRRYVRLESDDFLVPDVSGEDSEDYFHVVYYPKGAEGVEKGKCSIGLSEPSGDRDVHVRIEYYDRDDPEALSFSDPPLRPGYFVTCDDFDSAKKGDVTISVTLSYAQAGKATCLLIRHLAD